MGTRYDAVVIGAGVFGAWTAWHLVRAGQRVLLVDKYGPANARASSGGDTRVIRMAYGPDAIYTRMAQQSLPRGRIFSRGSDSRRCSGKPVCCGWPPPTTQRPRNRLRCWRAPPRQEVFYFGTAGDRRFSSPELPIWLDFGLGYYGFPDLDGRGFKVARDAHGEAFDPDTLERLPTPAWIAHAREFLARRFPALAEAPLLASEVCQYENTWNGDFVIDRHPAFDNVWMAGGGSGHGFKHGPAVGAHLVGRMLEDAPAEPRFSIATKHGVQRREVH